MASAQSGASFAGTIGMASAQSGGTKIPWNLVIPFVIGVAGTIMEFLSVAIVAWILIERTIEEVSTDLRRGLFSICSDATCEGIKSLSSADRAAQAFAVIAMIMSVMAVLMGIFYAVLYLTKRYEDKMNKIGKACGLLFLLADTSAFIVIPVFIYIFITYDPADDFGEISNSDSNSNNGGGYWEYRYNYATGTYYRHYNYPDNEPEFTDSRYKWLPGACLYLHIIAFCFLSGAGIAIRKAIKKADQVADSGGTVPVPIQVQPLQPGQFAQPSHLEQPVQYVQYGQPAQIMGQPVQYGQPAQIMGQPVQYGQPAQIMGQPVQYGQPAQNRTARTK